MNISIWVFVVLCIAALPTAVLMLYFIFGVIAIVIEMVLSLFTKTEKSENKIDI